MRLSKYTCIKKYLFYKIWIYLKYGIIFLGEE
jgi:hypothetical protein